MMKKLINYFRKRNDMKLRKWCVKLAVKTSTPYDYIPDTANKIYEWIKGLPESNA